MTRRLSAKAVKEYQLISRKIYDIEMLDSEAEEQGLKLLRLFKLIYRPIQKGNTKI